MGGIGHKDRLKWSLHGSEEIGKNLNKILLIEIYNGKDILMVSKIEYGNVDVSSSLKYINFIGNCD
ncbi:MAG: hypothetical protein C0392_03735 [Syntrophus sp. (in: bacteria)]|nr:hypothetical protein [Syntrophus sp. (in: bacteria)]